jgi:peptidoglycan/xylan/chitin deacetylase (PgdA/CDA1 family)
MLEELQREGRTGMRGSNMEKCPVLRSQGQTRLGRLPGVGRRVLFCHAVLLLLITMGCGTDPLCPIEEKRATVVVLTFDDGPVAADVADPAASPDPCTLLNPLHAILDKLQERDLRAVFYVKGTGNEADADVLSGIFADGILSIHRAGHVLGYHAYHHEAALWVRPPVPVSVVREEMREDLDRLEGFVDGVLGPTGFSRETVFTPIFRQPFGGGGIARLPAMEAAHELGWTYHGFRIDSVDWTDNADTDPTLFAHLPIATESDRVEYVRYRLREGAERNRERAVVDVLFHVNAFTAAHLDEWIDELDSAFEHQTGLPRTFGVPDDYLLEDDPAVDLTIICDLLMPWGLIDFL